MISLNRVINLHRAPRRWGDICADLTRYGSIFHWISGLIPLATMAGLHSPA
jgi:hypothetical protein